MEPKPSLPPPACLFAARLSCLFRQTRPTRSRQYRRLVRLLSTTLLAAAAACGVTALDQASQPTPSTSETAPSQATEGVLPVDTNRDGNASTPAVTAPAGVADNNTTVAPAGSGAQVHAYGVSLNAGPLTLVRREGNMVAVTAAQLPAAVAVAANYVVEASVMPQGLAFGDLCLVAKPNVSVSPALQLQDCNSVTQRQLMAVNVSFGFLALRNWLSVDTSACPDPSAKSCKLTFSTDGNAAGVLRIRPSLLAPASGPRGALMRLARAETWCLAANQNGVALRPCDAKLAEQRWLVSGPTKAIPGLQVQSEAGGCMDVNNANELVLIDCASSALG